MAAGMPKSGLSENAEARNPNAERNPKHEARKQLSAARFQENPKPKNQTT